MIESLDPVAAAMLAVLPGWVRLPGLTFVMPHTAYWAGLIVFPLVAIYLVRREARRRPTPVPTAVAYLLWAAGGFVGLHRFYLRAGRLGFVYIALFLLVLYGNTIVADARNAVSEADNTVKGAAFEVEHFGRLAEAGRAGAAERLAAARETLAGARAQLVEAAARHDRWGAFVGGMAYAIAILLLIDAFLIPVLRRRCLAREPPMPAAAAAEPVVEAVQARPVVGPWPFRVIDWISVWSGEFVAYWSVIAVFVYYYEVVARYVFNSPTNWAHESMFLMFGMQYLLSGAFALREDSHVRVDVIFERLSARTKVVTDIVTSVFFFIFTITLLVTGTIFALDSIRVWEVSFTEWAIQYWPVKACLALGALLIVLQGLAKLVRDIRLLGLRTG